MMRIARRLGAALLCIALTATVASAQLPRPDAQLTPGATNPAVTQSSIAETICQRGWTATIRPPEDITDAIKLQQLQRLGIPGTREADFEEDHLIPLQLGGAPADPANLWPEPRHSADGWNANRKDGLERVLNRKVCSGKLALAEAQQAIAQDWTAAYTRFVQVPRQDAEAAARARGLTGGFSSEGWYRSVDGSLVHGPTTAADEDDDYGLVMALCRDGTQSYSHNRRGTCSHHGGVSRWQ
jgi:hypothetical protein